MTDPRKHIATCRAHYDAAMASFEAYGLPSDRDEALRWQTELDRAVSQLDDEGNNFFDAAAKNGWSKIPSL